jgi:hypothetical protein
LLLLGGEAAVTSSAVAGMPAALARAGLRCCDGQSVLTNGKSGGASSTGTGTMSTSVPAARAQVSAYSQSLRLKTM